MASHFDSISNVCFNRESIRLKVRVVRLWSLPMFNNAAQTTVVRQESDSIPMLGLSLVPFNEVLNLDDNYEFLIDVIGVLTGVFPERRYEKDGKLTTMVVMFLLISLSFFIRLDFFFLSYYLMKHR